MGIALRTSKPVINGGSGLLAGDVTKPTDAVAGDRIFAFIATDSNGVTFTPPDGTWTELLECDSTIIGGQTLSRWYKTAGGSEPSAYTFTWDIPSAYQSAGIALFEDTGGTIDTPYGDAQAEDAAGSTITSPSITTTHPNDYVLSGYSQDNTTSDGLYAASAPAGLTLLAQTWGGLTNLGLSVFGELRVSAGAGGHTVTQSTGGDPTRGGATAIVAVPFTPVSGASAQSTRRKDQLAYMK